MFLSFCLPTFSFAYAEPLNFVSVALLPPLRSASDKSCCLCHVKAKSALLLFFKKPAPAYFVAKQKTPLSGCFFVSLLLLADVSFAYAEPSNFVSLALLPPLRFARTNPATFLIKQSPFCYFKKTVGDAFVAKQRTPAKRVFFVLFDEKIRVFIRP